MNFLRAACKWKGEVRMEESKTSSRYRSLLIGFLILDLIAFTLLAVAYFWNGDIGDQEIRYEDAELVFDDLSGQKVIPSGEPVGIYLKTDGVMVVDCGEVETAQGEICSPCNGLIQTGDYITAVNGTAISTKKELMQALSGNITGAVRLTFLRDGKSQVAEVTPVKTNKNSYMLGLWVKDDISGIGTVTFLCGNQFMALGHSVSDNDTGLKISSTGGGIYTTHITKINRSFVSMPGQLQGTILYKKDLIGIVEGNYDNGIGGYLDEEYVAKHYKAAEAMYIADPDEVQTGEAYIYSRLDGDLKKYKINILAVHTDTANKNMEFKVEDEDLIALTGGVCQGMSGSPIVQNGKLIGAVTHVLVDDPTEGYAVFIENMIK